MEKGSFCEHVRHKTKRHIKGKVESRQRQPAPGSPSAITVTAFCASWTAFKFTIKRKKKKYSKYFSLAASSPLKIWGQISGLRLGGVGGSSCYFISSGAATASLSTVFQSWNSECKSLADEMAGKQKLPRTQKVSKVLYTSSVSPGAGIPGLHHGWGLLENLGTSRWTVNQSSNIELMLCPTLLDISQPPYVWVLRSEKGVCAYI